MDLNASESYEFLDLSEVDDTERKEIIETLYTTPAAPSLHLQSSRSASIPPTRYIDRVAVAAHISSANDKKPSTPKPATSRAYGSYSAVDADQQHVVAKQLRSEATGSSNSKASRNVATPSNNGFAQPIQQFSKNEKPPQIGHVVRNVMIPRLITPIPIPFCAIVKPTTLTEVAVVPLRAPILTASAAAVKTHAEQSKPKVLVNAGGTKASSTGSVSQIQPTMHVQQQPPAPQQAPPQQQGQQQGVDGRIQAGQQTSAGQPNNIPAFAQHHHVGPAYAMPQGGMYMPAHSMQQVGPGMYTPMLQTGLPGNVYVNNVTANVNLHGWTTHPVQGFIPGGNQAYIHGEVPQQIQGSTEQNAVMQPVQQVAVPMNVNRTPRRGRGRGGNNGSRRGEYVPRQQQESPSPQDVISVQVDPQTMGTAYPPYGYQFGYPGFFPGPHQNMVHPQAQHAAGQHIYVAGPVPMYNNPPIYNYHPGSIIYPAMIPQGEYQVVDENGEERTINEPLMQPMWHQPMYAEDYVNAEMMPGDDINHNQSPMASVDTPAMLSPSYPIYDQQMQQTIEIQQHMNAVHIYEQMPQQPPNMHQPPHLQQNEDALSECSQQLQQEHLQMQHEQQVPPQYIMAGPMGIPIENQIEHCGSDHSNMDSMLNNSNEMLMPIEVPSVANNNVVVPAPIQSAQIVTNFVQQQPPQPHQQRPHIVYENMPSVIETNAISDYNQNVPNVPLQMPVHQNAPVEVVEYVVPVPTPTLTQTPISNSGSPSTEHTAEESTNANNNGNHKRSSFVHHDMIPNVPANISVSNGTIVQTIITKSMSWTSSQMKKTTQSVAVTATPTLANKQNSPNVHSRPAVAASRSHPHHQKSPASSPHDAERQKNSVSTTTASSTAVPQQFAPPAQAPAKHAPPATEPKQEVKAKKEEVLNLAPPVTSAPAAPAAGSWASLFDPKKPTNFTTSPSANTSTAPPLATVKRPVAKVAPFEGSAGPNAIQNIPPIVTPGALSYSAASAQGIPQTQSTTSGAKAKQAVASAQIAAGRDIDEWSLKFAEFLTKYKPDYSNVSLRPRGLTNRSNWCYINSILQALIGCPPFYNLLRALPKSSAAIETEIKTPTINAMVQFASEFSHLPPGARLNFNRREKVQKGGKDDMGGELQCDSAFEPNAIYKLWNASRSDVESQEDAEEFLGYVLNKLNDEMLEAIKLIAKPAPQENGDANAEPDDGDDWQMIYSNKGNKGSVIRQTDFGKTPLSDMFRGELRSRLQREGEHSTDVIQPFYTLQLNIEKAQSVKEALDILVGRDQLEGVTCTKTNQEVVAWQQITLEKLPPVLILHLKWFDFKSEGCTKILKTVEFPVELKIDTKILSSKKYFHKQRLYRLFAVVYHDGKQASKGHYVTDVYHPGYQYWLRYDDISVKPVSENTVLHPRVPRVPYLLYYRRSDTVTGPPATGSTNNQPQQQNSAHK